MNYNLSDSELSQVCEVITARTGLHFPVERWAMLGRNLASAALDFSFVNMSEFVQWFLSTELDQDQLKMLSAHLTVSETYFWREPFVFEALTDHIIPTLIRSKKNGGKSIRIWSAGCSSGEEAYSLAIALHKTVPDIKDWNISILATDINPKVIAKAADGIYGPWSFRSVPEWLIKRYFHPLEDRKYEIIPEIKKMVKFSCLSLTDDNTYSSHGDKMDITFCRNVLMYFKEEWVTKITRNLFNSLSADGWFVVSSSELSSQVFPQFTAVNFNGAVLYTKSKKAHVPEFQPIGLPKEVFVPITPSPRPSSSIALATEDLPGTSSPLHHVSPSPCLPSPSATPVKEKPMPTPVESTATKIFAIRLLANQGYLSEALTLCNEAIESEKLVPGFYFLRASILQEMDRSSEAIDSLKKAIYTDPEYVMGHFALGNLLNHQGNTRNAKRHFKNVLDLLDKCTNDEILPESEGLSVKYIREIILANMKTIHTK